MEVFIIWLILGGVVAIIAVAKGRNGFAWFLYGFLIFPIALVHVLVTSPSQRELDERALASGERVQCPFCAEVIRRQAKVCPHCQRDLGKPPDDRVQPPRLRSTRD